MSGDERFMRLALEQAARGRGTARPNPMVGAAVVRDGQVLAVGYHERAGGPHAEVVALEAAGEAARGADVYVNLEPCSHFGRTPPCADALVRYGVRRVFAGMIDPNPNVSGRGIQRLRDAGVEVHVGLLGDECAALNEDFVVYIAERRPFVTLKLAVSLDGRIADAEGQSGWISNEASRLRVQHLRAGSDAILVGSGTLRHDNPRLTVRDIPCARPPQRWVLDRDLRVDDAAAVLDVAAAPTVLVHGPDASSERGASLLARGVGLVASELEQGGRIALQPLLHTMASCGIMRLLVEGGGHLAGALLEADLVDRIELFVAPVVLGDRGAPAFVLHQAPAIGNARRGRLESCVSVDGDAHLSVRLAR